MKIMEFFRKLQFPVMLALGTYSAGTCMAGYFAPQLLPYAWLFPAVYALFAVIGLLLPGRLRLLLSAAGAAALIVPAVLFFGGNARILGLVLAVCYSALMLWSMSMGGWEQEKELPGGWIGAGLVILLIGTFISTFDPRLQHLLVGCKISLFVFALLAMLSLNRRSRALASGGRQGYTATMRRKNTMLTVGMFAIALAIALIPSVFDLLEAIWEWIKALIDKIVAMIPEETEPSTTLPTTESFTKGDTDGLLEIPYSRQNSPMLYVIMAVVALGVMVPLVFFAVRKLFRLIRDMVRKLYEKVTDGITLDAPDFLDEITDTRTDGESAYAYEKRKERIRQLVPDTRRMTPVQRIRYQYRQLMKKHPYWGDQSTARENLPKDAAQIYEKARYSEHTLSQQDAEQFAQKTENELQW